MTQINRTALVAHSAEKLYHLVLDVESYPDYLPWCSAATVAEQSDVEQLATITISKGPLNASFTTRNALTSPQTGDGSDTGKREGDAVEPGGEIYMTLVDGPFRHLDGHWRFHVLSPDACKVEMQMNFDFAPGPVGLLLTPVFAHICATLLNAFVQRANELYGSH